MDGIEENKDDSFTADDVELIPEPEAEAEAAAADMVPRAELDEQKEKFMRMYAEFDNYRKRMARDREEFFKYQNEQILGELLTSLDNMDIALKHGVEGDAEAVCKGLLEGVEATRRELLRTMEKFGLSYIDAEGKAFDPQFHHAISQVESEDIDEGTVVSVFRKGYMYKDKILRAPMVAVSKRPVSG